MYYVFDNISDFDIWHSAVNSYFGYPNDLGTLRYTIGTEIDNQVYALVADGLPPELRYENYTIVNITAFEGDLPSSD